VLIRHFATNVERHHNPALKDAPLVVASDSRVRRVVAASALPHQRGIEPKMTIKQALLLCPEAQIGGDDPFGDEAAFLARHRVSMLPLSKDMARRRLPLLGIDTVG
jgi:nucleotidyltransferase/DNA polymerase involved in DNA repair